MPPCMSEMPPGAEFGTWKSGSKLSGDVECAVDDRRLEVDGPDLTAAVDPPHLAVVVLRRPPLAAVRFGLLAQDLAARRDAQAERVVGRVQPVVQRPGQAARLPFHVGDAAVARIEHLPLVGDAVAVGIGELVDIPIVGLEHEEFAVAKRKRNARQHQLVGEHGVLVVNAIAIGVLVARDAADRLAGVGAVGIAHVGPHLEHVHAAVAVECDADRIFDQRVGEHRLDPESRRQLEVLLLVGGIEPLDRRLLAEIGAQIDLRLERIRRLSGLRLRGRIPRV